MMKKKSLVTRNIALLLKVAWILLSNTASKKSRMKGFMASVELEMCCPCDTGSECDLMSLSLSFQLPSMSPPSVFLVRSHYCPVSSVVMGLREKRGKTILT